MTHTEDDVERVRKAIRGKVTLTDIARAALAAMPSDALLREARDACAACFRVIAEAGLSERLEAELQAAGVENGFGARMDAALKAQPAVMG